MDLFQAILLGIIQGLTEFIPISSSGHLVLTQYFIGVGQDSLDEALIFNLTLHVGTVVAVVYCYWIDIKQIFTTHKSDNLESPLPKNILLLLILSMIGTGIVVLPFKDFVEAAFQEPRFAAYGLLGTTLILLVSLKGKGEVSLRGMNCWKALLIGVAQGIAVFPGISRSGMTIVVAMLLGFRGPDAARYSFLLSAPTIIIASALEARKVILEGAKDLDILTYAIGFIVSAIFGVLAIKFVLAIIKRSNIAWLSIYCFIVALVSLFLID